MDSAPVDRKQKREAQTPENLPPSSSEPSVSSPVNNVRPDLQSQFHSLSLLSPMLEHQSPFQTMDEDERARFYADRRQALIEGIEAASNLIQRFEGFNSRQFALNLSLQAETSQALSNPDTPGPSTRMSLSVLSLGSLPSAIDHATKSQLLGERFNRVLEQLNNLRSRIVSSTSRVLVTGDLNAGKSSVVNALLRQHDFLPTDQQPCTSAFCEVADADRLNSGQVEVHAVLEGRVEAYEQRDEASFHVYPLSDLSNLIGQREEQLEEEESEAEAQVDEGIGEEIAEKGPPPRPDNDSHYAVFKAYVKPNPPGEPDGDSDDNNNKDKYLSVNGDRKGKKKAAHDDNDHEDAENRDEKPDEDPGFIHDTNSFHSLSLIDSPGLNVSNLKTTSVFARQSEIDIVIFVVSAENHFTLSAEEFLRAASLEKPYIFIVVNKWSTIRDRKFAARRISEQIKRLSPDTYRLRDELVHFVDAESFLQDKSDSSMSHAAFKHLESSLRSFVLLKRAQSKLSPAKTYLSKLYMDMNALCQYNLTFAKGQQDSVSARLKVIAPQNDRLLATSNQINDAVSDVIESSVETIKNQTWSYLEQSALYISQGELNPKSRLSLPPFSSIFDVWNWSRHVLDVFVQSLEDDVRHAENEARNQTEKGVMAISNDLSTKFLSEVEDAAPRRQFQPAKMFRNRPQLGLSATQVEVEFSDLFDIARFTQIFRREGGDTKAITDGHEGHTGLVSIGAGGMLAAYAGKTLGVKTLLESIGQVADLLSSESARKWAVPLATIAGIGFVGFVVIDLPFAVPRNLGRKIHANLIASIPSQPSKGKSASLSEQPHSFASKQGARISYQSRRVLTVAGDDLRTAFRAALEQSQEERKMLEEEMNATTRAISWLEEFEKDVEREVDRIRNITLGEAKV